MSALSTLRLAAWRQILPTLALATLAGWLAERHAAASAEVVWLGKPHALIYTVCREALGRMGSRHFLAIGDSLAHDIAGRHRRGAGIDGLCQRGACPPAVGDRKE